MTATRKGGIRAMKTSKKRYGSDYPQVIGRMGGYARVATKGFGADSERAREAGRKGGHANLGKKKRGRIGGVLA